MRHVYVFFILFVTASVLAAEAPLATGPFNTGSTAFVIENNGSLPSDIPNLAPGFRPFLLRFVFPGAPAEIMVRVRFDGATLIDPVRAAALLANELPATTALFGAVGGVLSGPAGAVVGAACRLIWRGVRHRRAFPTTLTFLSGVEVDRVVQLSPAAATATVELSLRCNHGKREVKGTLTVPRLAGESARLTFDAALLSCSN